jgi:hypothetical protein
VTSTAGGLEGARGVADAVLYEGYVLYPYRATSSKNQVRWQWGVLMPEDVVALDPSERSFHSSQVLVDGGRPAVQVNVRFLQVQHRSVERRLENGYETVSSLDVGDATYVEWDEARERELRMEVPAESSDRTFEIEGGSETEELRDDHGVVGRLVRTWVPLEVGVVAKVEHPESPYAVSLVSVRVENRTRAGDPGPDRPAWLRRSLVAAHQVLEAEHGAFLSLLDPPEWARPLAAACINEGVFPVLGPPAGQDAVVLATPIILYDHAELAPESETAFFDALEVDELLSLRTMTLSEQEKREVRGTDPRTASLLQQVDSMPEDLWERLHGTVRYLDSMTAAPAPRAPATDEVDVPWWDPGSDSSVDPEHDAVLVGDVEVRRGSRVILRPGVRRADAYDLFLAGRSATVAAVLFDVDHGEHLAVTVDEDPGSDLKAAHGRYLYFAPDEVEPVTVPAEGSRS